MNLEIWTVEVYRCGCWQFCGSRQTAQSARALVDELSGKTNTWFGYERNGEQSTITGMDDSKDPTYRVSIYEVKP